MNESRPRLLVLASTYPRWAKDPEPGFVHELCVRLTQTFEVIALVPDSPNSDPSGVLDGVEVVRYRYAPRRWQTLVNNGGIATNLSRFPWKWLLVPSFLVVQWWVAARLVRSRRCALVHAHWLIPQGLVALMATFGTSTRYVVTSHGGDLFGFRGRISRVIKRMVCSSARWLAVVSPAMKQEVNRLGLPGLDAHVLPMGVDLKDRFSPDPRTRRSESELLFVGRLVEKKGLHHLIAALPHILQAYPRLQLTVVGHGPQEAALVSRVADFGLGERVSFLGPIENQRLPELYRRATLCVAPFIEAASGDQEGLGLVVIEALGCGCPVVASELPATRTLPVYKVKPGCAQALASRICEVLRMAPTQRAIEVESQRQWVFDRYDWSSRAGEYAVHLEEACNRSWVDAERNGSS